MHTDLHLEPYQLDRASASVLKIILLNNELHFLLIAVVVKQIDTGRVLGDIKEEELLLLKEDEHYRRSDRQS